MPQFDVVVVGSLNLDLVTRTARFPQPGETVQGSAFDEFPGGKGLNQSVSAARSGARVALVGAVGGDTAGAYLRSIAIDEGINDTHLRTVDAVVTGRAIITVDDHGENSIIVVAGANHRASVTELPTGRVILAQLETTFDAVISAFEVGRSRGAVTILNPAPAGELPDELLTLCDVLVPNEHEVELLGGVEALLSRGVQHLVVTRGAHGVDFWSRGRGSHLDAFEMSPVDTTGAGDSFCGALSRRLSAGDDLERAVIYAAAAGALATTERGAVPSQPSQATIEALLAEQPNRSRAIVTSDRKALFQIARPEAPGRR